jgi:UDP-N-acetyl-D-glucosamine dehydrogenase
MRTEREQLAAKIGSKTANVCVLGLGYVGLPLGLTFAEAGFRVVGIDVDEEKVATIRSQTTCGKNPSFAAGRAGSSFEASTDLSLAKGSDAAIICVPTPLSKTKEPDLSFVLQAAQGIATYLHPGQLIVLESTTYPGTTRELLLPLFEESGLKAGQDFFLAYSPERIDPGNERFTLSNTPKVVAGITPNCLQIARLLYSQIVEQVVTVTSTDSAEMTKLLENTFRSVNIALVNEFAIMCHRLGLDVWEVIEAAATKPFGFLPFYPGPGLGGHCIPVDPHYLSWRLKLFAYRARLIELADEINREMPRFVLEKVTEALNRNSKSVKGSRILILGVSYKKNSEDIRESPALDIMKLLDERGGEIFYHDPYVSRIAFNGKELCSLPLDLESVGSFDIVVIVTDHSDFSAGELVKHSRLVIDSRNMTRGIESEKIVRL